MPALGLFFYYIGILLKKQRGTFLLVIRTPWTLSSDKVWDKTHRLGSKLFKISGLLALISIFFSEYAFFFVFIPIISFTITLIIYSYYEFKKEEL
jgi:uncharacterized membrane protein